MIISYDVKFASKSHRMKVLLLCDYPLDASEINGGVSAASYNLVQSLLEHTDVTIVVAGFWPGHESSQIGVIEKRRLTVVRCPPQRALAHFRDFGRERMMFQSIIDTHRPDVVHAQGEGIYASVAVNSGRPNVYTIHGIRLKELGMERAQLGAVRHWLRASLVKRHHSKATNIIAINQYTRDAINGLHNARVWTIQNPVSTEFFGENWSNERQPGRLLQVGGVRARKDIPTLVSAVDIINRRGLPVALDIVGPNDESLAEVQAIIERQRLGRLVQIHGLVDAVTLMSLYESADVFVLSSIEESSPISIVQAMAAGLPVVATDVGGIREMMKDGATGLLCPAGDANTLAEKLSTVIENRVTRRSFSAEGRRLAEAEWSSRSVAEQTLAVYAAIGSSAGNP